jgi:hypothetical protein
LYSKNNPRIQQAHLHRKIALQSLPALVKVKALKLLFQLRVRAVRMLHLLKVKITIKLHPLQLLPQRRKKKAKINCLRKLLRELLDHPYQWPTWLVSQLSRKKKKVLEIRVK